MDINLSINRRRRLPGTERLRAMGRVVLEVEEVRISELAEQFSVSLMTVHRDLDELQSRGLLRKYRGVAAARQSTRLSVSTAGDTRPERADTDQALALALATSPHLSSAQSIILDDSDAAQHIIPYLQSLPSRPVVTNSLNAINKLSVFDTISLVAAGRDYDTARGSFSGHMPTDLLRHFPVDLLIMSATAISGNRLYCTSSRTVEANRAMLDYASTKILIAHHTTFVNTALYDLTSVAEFDHVIVDDDTPSHIISNISMDTPDLRVARTT